ncbi:MAG: hypothetical protein ACFFER_16075, partial [Candidatus Thorarchaeota archaeon]
VGLNTRINGETRAVSAIASIVRLVAKFPHTRKLVWLLDESQRINDLRPKQKSAIQSGIQSCFNQCPVALSILPAYSGRQPEKIEDILSRALISRVGTSRRVSISRMSAEDAKEFIEQLFEAFRPNGYSGEKYFPFSEAAIDYILRTLEDEHWYMKPRNIMKILESVVEDHEESLHHRDLIHIALREAAITMKSIQQSSETVSALKRIE